MIDYPSVVLKVEDLRNTWLDRLGLRRFDQQTKEFVKMKRRFRHVVWYSVAAFIQNDTVRHRAAAVFCPYSQLRSGLLKKSRHV